VDGWYGFVLAKIERSEPFEYTDGSDSFGY
jgi:hypothetical protein